MLESGCLHPYILLQVRRPLEVLEAGHPVGGLFALELRAVNLALALGVQDGVVAAAHVLCPGELGEGGVLVLADVVELEGVAVVVAGRIALAHEVGVVPVLPPVVVGKLFPEPLLAAVEGAAVDGGIYECWAAVDGLFLQAGLDVDAGFGLRADGAENGVGPSRLLLKMLVIFHSGVFLAGFKKGTLPVGNTIKLAGFTA